MTIDTKSIRVRFGQPAFLLQHVFVRKIGPVFGKKQQPAGFPGIVGMAAEGAANQLDKTIHIGGDAMDGADEGILSAADHAHS